MDTEQDFCFIQNTFVHQASAYCQITVFLSKTFKMQVSLTVDKDFKWANTGATVFGAQPQRKADEDEGDSGDEVVHNDDIHFEPIVSLPEVKKLPEYKRTLR